MVTELLFLRRQHYGGVSMSQLRTVLSLLWVLTILILSVGNTAAQTTSTSTTTTTTATTRTEGTVTLTEPSWQTVLDKLFGTPDSGLLDGTKTFEFRAK